MSSGANISRFGTTYTCWSPVIPIQNTTLFKYHTLKGYNIAALFPINSTVPHLFYTTSNNTFAILRKIFENIYYTNYTT